MKHLFRLLLLLIPLTAVAQSSLPPCPPTGVKHMCFGEESVKSDDIIGKYVGEFFDGQRSGKGSLTWSDGERFSGEWKNDKADGWGTSDWPDGRKYFGEWKDHKRSGQGTMTWSSGRIYVGEWRNDERNGIGTHVFPDGKRYVGNWKNDKRNGQGIEYHVNGGVLRSGNWSDNNLAQSFAIDTRIFPYGADSIQLALQANDQIKADRNRIAAQVANQASAPQRTSTLATGRNERRVALIVGNSKYARNPLDNPVNDAADLDAALKSLGFKTTLLRDANIIQMRNATRQFADDVATSDVALIYFAGHGIEAKGRNYLIPVSADIRHEYELEDQAYDAGRWLDMLENIKGINKQRVNIVILDACRNNDLSRGWRSSSRGLARMDAPKGTFIAFSTAPGKVAMDGAKGQRNSPFTKNLLRTIQTPDMPIELMFKEVRRLVLEDTKDEQVPWDNSSLVGDFVFKRSR